MAEVFTTPAQYPGCKDWDCTVLRTAMGVDPAKGCIQNSEGYKMLIMNVIDAANKQGIYVITDFRYHSIRLNEVRTFFTEIAKKYGKQPNVIYKIYNEPKPI